MRLSVVIPTRNEAEYVARAIESAYECGAEEVIVADGGSCDDTTSIAIRQAARVVMSLPGRARQQNAGAAMARGDFLLFLHADNWLDVRCGAQIRQATRSEDFAAAAFQQRIESDSWAFRFIERGNAARARWLKTPYGDQGILIRRAVFEQLGGFPDVRLMEDLLLSRKLRRIGRIILLPGPLHISPRRWQSNGVLRQTLRNWMLVAALRLGISPDSLARYYAPWDPTSEADARDARDLESAPPTAASRCAAQGNRLEGDDNMVQL